jgi:polyphosphate kinase 2 (PPK2 family)
MKKPKMGRKEYEKELRKLQVELCELQEWVKQTGLRVIVVFEGRDGAGKGGTIKAITERVSPRVFRVVALPAPSDREKTQLYMQRYVAHFPAAGEIIIFDRSWYNRAGVEYVMGFCSKQEHRRFLELCPVFESNYITADGIILVKVLAGGERRGTGAPLRGKNRGSAASMEAQPHGLTLSQQMV